MTSGLDLSTWLDLVAEVESRAPLTASKDHGAHHWRLVAWTGSELLEEVTGGDPLVVLLFALFHDSQRQSEYADPQHGVRGAQLARELLAQRGDLFEARQLDVLVDACNRHTGAGPTEDPTRGICWDADRLNLWRVGTTPSEAYLSTAAAKAPERIAWARDLQTFDIAWEAIAQRYRALLVGHPPSHVRPN